MFLARRTKASFYVTVDKSPCSFWDLGQKRCFCGTVNKKPRISVGLWKKASFFMVRWTKAPVVFLHGGQKPLGKPPLPIPKSRTENGSRSAF